MDSTLESFTHHQRGLGHGPYLNQNVQDCCPSKFSSLMKPHRQLKKYVCIYAVCLYVTMCLCVHTRNKFIALKEKDCEILLKRQNKILKQK